MQRERDRIEIIGELIICSSNRSGGQQIKSNMKAQHGFLVTETNQSQVVSHTKSK